MSIKLRPSGGAAGTVTQDTASVPLADIEVYATDAAGYWLHWYSVTDDDGLFGIPGLRAGASHKIRFWDPDGAE